MSTDESTSKFRDFERLAISPDSHSTEELLTAFRTGNIAVAETLIEEGPDSAKVRKLEISVNAIGEVLRQRREAEAKGHP